LNQTSHKKSSTCDNERSTRTWWTISASRL